MAQIKVIDVYLRDWMVRGEFVEDTQYYNTVWFVCADLEDGRTLIHNVSFEDVGSDLYTRFEGLDAAKRLAKRVEDAGSINEEHWYFHDFFSHSLESRMDIEAEYEQSARCNIDGFDAYNPWFSGGHL